MNESGTIPTAALALSDLRKRIGRSQAEIANATGTTQSGVSRLEHQSDMRLSTLVEYVTALGGHLHLVVEHGIDQIEIEIPLLRKQRGDLGHEFRVIWQDQDSRGLIHVGWLEIAGEQYLFSYTNEAKSHPRFQPFPSFPLFDKEYRSSELFPFFAVRLISTADPGYRATLDALGLTRDTATPAELLARSPTESPHDTIQVVPEPTERPDGSLVRLFLVSGIRHADQQNPQALSQLIENLAEGTQLELVPDPHNPANPEALQLAVDGKLIGWVPDYLVSEVHSHINSNRSVAINVSRANGPDVPWHLRLLCQLTLSAKSNS
ncbi:hypothetical protein [Candidatus Poriferisocius sp.]|uniref:hypothetical protein n=1 Tax=Candidatus Poriferisocius sp. TaxID=3101276 RepID=UPI003B029F77